MNALMVHLSGLAVAASGALVASVWQGMVLAVGAAICLRMAPGLSAAARSVVWLAVFAVIALLDLRAVPSASPGAGGGFAVDARWALGLAGLWAAVSLLRVARLVAGAVELAGVARRATRLAVGGERGWREPAICSSDEVERPGIVGFFRPRILLPAGLCERLTAAELEGVVLHEREHLRRGDDWTNLLQKVGLALMPLNPVLAWVERRLCRERELACDDQVLRQTGARKAYAACLAHLAEEALLRKPLLLALGLMGRGSELAGRIHRILGRPETALGRGATVGVSGVLIAGLLGGGLELSQCPRLVRFASPEIPVVAAAVSGSEVMRVSSQADRGAGHASVVKVAAAMKREKVSTGRARPWSQGPGVVKARTTRAAGRQHWVILTRWVDGDTAEPALVRIRLAVPASTMYSGVSYAGLPVEGGWLVFQL